LSWKRQKRRSKRIGGAKNRKSASELSGMRARLRQTDTPLLTNARVRASFRNAGWPYQVSGITCQASAGISVPHPDSSGPIPDFLIPPYRVSLSGISRYFLFLILIPDLLIPDP
jgi:hypothetical protein